MTIYCSPQKDSDWSDEERVKEDRFSFLADVMGVGGPSFDDDGDLLTSNDDEDLQKDPVSLIDLRVRFFLGMARILITGRPICRHISLLSFGRVRREMRMGLGRLQGNSAQRR